MPSPTNDPDHPASSGATPWLVPPRRLDGTAVRELIAELRRLGGEELLVRRLTDPRSAGPTATRMRRVLGPDFYVIRRGTDIWARARKVGEPELSKRRLRMGPEWQTLAQAAASLGVSGQWLRVHYIDTGRIPKYRYGTRVVVRTEDVEAARGDTPPGGAAVGRIGER